MLYYKHYKGHSGVIYGEKKKFDNTIYTFDIETTSFIKYNGKIEPAIFYDSLSKEEQEKCEYRSTMYIWQLSINEDVYFGRTWDEFIEFLDMIEKNVSECKTIFVHNLSFEFQFLKSVLHFESVMARKSHKVMTAVARDYNIVFRCSFFMSNCALEKLSEVYNLPVKKQVGDLEYSKLRHSATFLSEQELKYAEYDCLVVYHYIKFELKTYEYVNKIPITSTGHVRRELKDLTVKDFKYKYKVKKSINIDPHIYNLLVEAFQGGYTHANYSYTDEILKNIDSYDIASSYPYVMVSHKFPMTEFKKCSVKRVEQMSPKVAYLLVVKFTNIKSKYFNTFISASKCRNIKGAKYDNGRIIEAKEVIITLTDVDFRFYLEAYNLEYEILEAYFSVYGFLPIQFINFILDKYVIKTEYKGVDEKELEYQLEKMKFNALYGMSVTNMIKDEVIYSDLNKSWEEKALTNEEIINKLWMEKRKAFLSFSWGVWVTAHARNNLLRRVISLDEYAIYMDTDSIKLAEGYDKNVFNIYNESVKAKLENVSEFLKIPFSKFAPLDKYGVPHLIGVFESETKKGRLKTYDEFITQGAKKYAVKIDDDIKITVAGVPKCGAKGLKRLEDFKDNFVFKYEDTNKHLLIYVENQDPILMTDYLGQNYIVKDVSGCALIPTTYILGKSLEYTNLISDNSSKRAIYKE